MKILMFILSAIICIALYVFMNIYADKKAKDSFQWGYWTCFITVFILDIVFKF